jgi:hypothetical protein
MTMATTSKTEQRGRTRPGRPLEPRREPLGHQPRIVEEHDRVGPYGDEMHEVIDEYGRRFWSFRPTVRQRYDLWGVGWFWWLALWLIIIGLIVWGWGWG